MLTQRRILGLFTLSMINVAAIISLRNLSIMVEYGFSSVFYYVLAGLLFFIPTALCCAELATGWPKAGGIYSWVSEAFGEVVGFFAIWMAWMLSIAWFPAVLTFTAGALAYMFAPELIHNKVYMVTVMLTIFWGATFLNFLSLKTSGWVSSIGVILGTIIPGFLIIALGVLWLYLGKDIKIDMSFDKLIPTFELEKMVFFAGVVLSLSGMEMSAFHAREAKNPQCDYPRAILLSAIIILTISIFGSLCIAFVVEPKDVNLFAGLMQAFKEFFGAFDMLWMIPWLALFAFLGSIAGVNTWIIGPAKGILTSAQHGFLPPWMHKINKNGMPVGTLLVQAVLGSILALSVFLFMPNTNSAFWIITALTVQFAMVMYILIFAATIRLRYSQPNVPRAYKIIGGKLGVWIVAGLGILCCVFTMALSFIPPHELETGSKFHYQLYLVLGLILLSLPPVYFTLFKKPHWHVELDSD